MYIPMATIFALVAGGAFMLWFHFEQKAARTKREEREREHEERSHERELKRANTRAEEWKKEAIKARKGEG